jgi:hypothetical protein
MSLTPKQEAFAQAIVTGVSQSDAYRAAYKVRPGTKAESVNQNASRIMANVNVMSRVAELRLSVAKKAQITLRKPSGRLDEASQYGGQGKAIQRCNRRRDSPRKGKRRAC